MVCSLTSTLSDTWILLVVLSLLTVSLNTASVVKLSLSTIMRSRSYLTFKTEPVNTFLNWSTRSPSPPPSENGGMSGRALLAHSCATL